MRWISVASISIGGTLLFACGSSSSGTDSASKDAAADRFGSEGGSSSGSSGASSSGSGSGAGSGASSTVDGASSAGASSASSGDGSAPSDAAGCSMFQAAIVVAAPGAVGEGCVPDLENDPTFGGFAEQEISFSTDDPQCQSGVCLVNHFRGRVSCPYGQDAQGNGPDGMHGCVTPKTCAPVMPNGIAGQTSDAVPAQCADRPPTDTVYCSCRCAEFDGTMTDGATYCTCPSGLTCTALVPPIGGPDASLAERGGSFCVKPGTQYDGNAMCSTTCDPTTTPCP